MSDILVYNAVSQANKQLRTELGEPVNLQAALCVPNLYASYACIPKLNTSNSLCVYDNTVNFRGGNCCLWTVPEGAAKVRFELWGAGAGTSPGACCSGSPFGATGAYASVIMDAVPGCQYTLCAGAANSTQLFCTCSIDVSGCPSFVTGYGLTNFCASGGCSSLSRRMTSLTGATGTASCVYKADGIPGFPACICNGANANNFCVPGTSCPTGFITRSYDADRKGYGTATTGTVYSIPSMYAADCFDNNFYGCMCDQPTLLPDGTISAICCVSYTSGNCCGAAFGGACAGIRCQPGKGGSYNHMMGGAVSGYGDWGRTGMVKVSWC